MPSLFIHPLALNVMNIEWGDNELKKKTLEKTNGVKVKRLFVYSFIRLSGTFAGKLHMSSNALFRKKPSDQSDSCLAYEVELIM